MYNKPLFWVCVGFMAGGLFVNFVWSTQVNYGWQWQVYMPYR